MSLPQDKQEEAKMVFEVFDKKYAGTVDAFYLGDMLRCLNLAVTNAECEKRGQTPKPGTKQLKVEEFLAIYQEFFNMPSKTWGTFEDFMEGLKLYDKDQNGKLQLSELNTVLVNMAEKLSMDHVNEILSSTETKDDDEGLIAYAPFVKKIMAGPFPEK